MSETMCCPLSGGEDGPTCSSTQVRSARKLHQCCECYDIIRFGQRYEYVSGIWDGCPSSYKTCLLCVEIRNHFGCEEGWTIGEVWNQLEESFFPEMTAGGPCMAGLSPEAKARMFELRLEWMFRSELEIDGARPPQVSP